MLYAVLPIKQLSLAKQRLSGVLSEQERQGLFQAMLEDVLSLLQSYQKIEQVFIVSQDPLVKLLAEKYQCIYVKESGKGLNQAVKQGVLALPEAATKALILHGDLPLLSESALDELLAIPTDVAIASDAVCLGTNLMCLNLAAKAEQTLAHQFSFAYGQASCQAHQKEAQRLGLKSQVLLRAELALDIDKASDVIDLIAMTKASNRTCLSTHYLLHSGIVSRLATMELGVTSSVNPEQAKVN